MTDTCAPQECQLEGSALVTYYFTVYNFTKNIDAVAFEESALITDYFALFFLLLLHIFANNKGAVALIFREIFQ